MHRQAPWHGPEEESEKKRMENALRVLQCALSTVRRGGWTDLVASRKPFLSLNVGVDYCLSLRIVCPWRGTCDCPGADIVGGHISAGLRWSAFPQLLRRRLASGRRRTSPHPYRKDLLGVSHRPWTVLPARPAQMTPRRPLRGLFCEIV